MIKSENDPFLKYYHRELTYLRNSGVVFADKHPKIARRLGMESGEVMDPHVARLIESFAFLTARVSQEIDDRIPEVATALLSVLAPQLVAPIPAMATAQFVVDPEKAKISKGYQIDRETPLYMNAEEGVACRFRTGYPVTLWPIEVAEVDFVPTAYYSLSTDAPWYLRLKLKSIGLSFSELDVKKLTFYIHGDHVFRIAMYEGIFAQDKPMGYAATDKQKMRPLTIRPIGFEEDELLLPCPKHVHPAYQLLLEYFHFSKKFFYFEVDGIDTTDVGDEMELLIPIRDAAVVSKASMNPNHFLLGCTPIVNLFPKVTDPQRIDHRTLEYRLVPDQRRERTTEIYMINEVLAARDDNPEPQHFSPYFSFNHDALMRGDNAYWFSRRVSSDRKDIPGTDVLLSFVDLAFNPKLPPVQVVYADTLCTNRFLADQVPAGAELMLEDKAPISRVTCLDKPTSQVYSPSDGESLWRLISSLAINHLTLTAGDNSVQALKEMLRLYAGPFSAYRHAEIDSILAIETRRITRRVGDHAWKGFIEGLEIRLTIDEEHFEGSSAFMMAAILRRSLAMQVSINSFIELVLYSPQRQSEWMRWQPLSGVQPLL